MIALTDKDSGMKDKLKGTKEQRPFGSTKDALCVIANWWIYLNTAEGKAQKSLKRSRKKSWRKLRRQTTTANNYTIYLRCYFDSALFFYFLHCKRGKEEKPRLIFLIPGAAKNYWTRCNAVRTCGIFIWVISLLRSPRWSSTLSQKSRSYRYSNLGILKKLGKPD